MCKTTTTLLLGLLPFFLSAGNNCCNVTFNNVEEMPSESKMAYSVSIPNADFKMSKKTVGRNMQKMSGNKPLEEGTLLYTSTFFWSEPMNDSAMICMLILPEGSGTIIHSVLKTSEGWVDPGSGSQASFFADYLKNIALDIHNEVLKEKVKDVSSDQKSAESDLKKTNKKIKKLRKKIIRSNGKISSIENEISMLQGEQKRLISEITGKKTRMMDIKSDDKKSYKQVKNEKKGLEKTLKKTKKSEEKLRRKILDHQNDIRNYEEDISKLQGTRDHYKRRIQETQQSRRDLKEKLE
jgi:predicted  nucleic acid-binding Zn-ribbon protein